MTTKNIQDVVAEKVEKAIIRLAATGCFEGKGDKILQPYADWLTTTLTQLVKEVEAGERDKNLHYIDHLFNFHHCNCDLTPPTSDEEK